MEDVNIGCKPYKKGDKLIIEVEVTDENLSFDYLGKCLTGRINTSELGFRIDLVSFWEDKYKDNIPLALRQEIYNKLNNVFEDIGDLLSIKR